MVSYYLFAGESVSVDSAAFAPSSPAIILVVMRCSIVITNSRFMSYSLAVIPLKV